MSQSPTDGKPQAPLMIGVSGLRGIVGESLTPEVAMRFAGGFGAWLHARDTHAKAVVARDGRAGGDEVVSWAVDGLRKSGVSVLNAGVCMTPTVGVLVDALGADGAIIVTASHNPQEWNGLKLLRRGEDLPATPEDPPAADAAAPNARQAAEIIKNYHAADARTPTGRPIPQVLSSAIDDPTSHHFEAVRRAMDSCDLTTGSARVVVDSVNSSGAEAVRRLPDEFGVDLVGHIGGDNSGIFPHTPEPTAENLSGEGGLCDAVPGLKADIGFAQDPDGDRLAIVDETGRYIGEEYTLALCAVSILEAHRNAPPSPKGELSPKVAGGVSSESKGTPSDPAGAGPPPPSATGEDQSDEVVLCANLSTSRMIDDIAARYGASVVRTAVGEANVVEAMKRLNREGKTVLLGGEGNGGVIWPEVTYVRDSLGSMALVLSLMARTGKTVSELVADIPSYAIVKRKQPLANKSDAQPAIERIARHYASERVDTQDGVRVDFDDKKAWVHVRASNTEPILRLIGEARDEATANAILDEVARLVEG